MMEVQDLLLEMVKYLEVVVEPQQLVEMEVKVQRYSLERVDQEVRVRLIQF